MDVRGWIGIVGTRRPADRTRALAARAARWAVEWGFGVVSGGAAGADEAALDAAGPLGWAILPWPGFRRRSWPGRVTVYDPVHHPEWAVSVDRHHPAPGRLDPVARRLLARNYGIVAACSGLMAFPRPDGGGTAQAVRVALALGRPVLVLPDPVPEGAEEQVAWFFEWLEREMKGVRRA